MIKKAGNYFTTAYLLLMFCVYPFYMENGYYNIGEAKYNFFMRISAAAFLILFVVYFLWQIGQIREKIGTRQAYLIEWDKVSLTDLLVLLYATFLFLSYAFSDNKDEALWGTEGWYMGCILLLLLCGLYFLISRMWKGEMAVFYGALLASGLVFLLGICNRFSIYPLTADTSAQPDFISTLGNINWFCGYISVIAPIGMGLFVFESKSLWRRWLLAVYALITFMAGFCQGSSSVFLWFGGVFFFLLWISLQKQFFLKNWCLLLFIWGIAAQTVGVLRYVFEGSYNYNVDNICGYFTDTCISLWIAAAALIAWCFLRFFDYCAERSLEEKKEDSVTEREQFVRRCRRWMIISICALFGAWAGVSFVHTCFGIPFLKDNSIFLLNQEWGHGRGAAFYAGIRTFSELPFLHKLIGAGPDCFAASAYEISELAGMLRENFGTARLTNAHNELLTALVNTGILGVCTYIAVFVSFISRCCKKGKDKVILYIPALCVFCYLVHNMVSFAQVLNYPFVFLLFGMGEAIMRRQA